MKSADAKSVEHLTRSEEVFCSAAESEAKECEAMSGLIKEAGAIMEDAEKKWFAE